MQDARHNIGSVYNFAPFKAPYTLSRRLYTNFRGPQLNTGRHNCMEVGDYRRRPEQRK